MILRLAWVIKRNKSKTKMNSTMKRIQSSSTTCLPPRNLWLSCSTTNRPTRLPRLCNTRSTSACLSFLTCLKWKRTCRPSHTFASSTQSTWFRTKPTSRTVNSSTMGTPKRRSTSWIIHSLTTTATALPHSSTPSPTRPPTLCSLSNGNTSKTNSSTCSRCFARKEWSRWSRCTCKASSCSTRSARSTRSTPATTTKPSRRARSSTAGRCSRQWPNFTCGVSTRFRRNASTRLRWAALS